MAQITHRSQYALGRPLPSLNWAPPCVVPRHIVQDLHRLKQDISACTSTWTCNWQKFKVSRERGAATDASPNARRQVVGGGLGCTLCGPRALPSADQLHIYMRMHMHIYICTSTCTCTRTYMHIYMHVHMHMHEPISPLYCLGFRNPRGVSSDLQLYEDAVS